MMNVEKTTLGIQTCSVSVSEHDASEPLCDAAFKLNHRRISFSACDCNLEGTERPSCDRETGECLCRIGVTGIFCDECAPGYDSAFPACKECHPCNAFWTDDITDVQRAAQIMRTFVRVPGPDVRPGGNPYLQRMLEMHSQLDELANLTGLSPPEVAKLEKTLAKMRFVLQLSHSGPGSLRLNCGLF